MKRLLGLPGLLGLSLLALSPGARAADCKDSGVQLNTLASADQQIRQEANLLEQSAQATSTQKAALQQRWRRIDADNLVQFKAILAACGWPATAKDSHSAWLLAQHADSDPAFQRHARTLLTQSVEAGVGAPRDLAYLADRIATGEGRALEYGTQFSQTDRCMLVLDPVDDRALVNRRRLAIGLPSLEEYEAEGRRRFIPADCAAPAAATAAPLSTALVDPLPKGTAMHKQITAVIQSDTSIVIDGKEVGGQGDLVKVLVEALREDPGLLLVLAPARHNFYEGIAKVIYASQRAGVPSNNLRYTKEDGAVVPLDQLGTSASGDKP